MNDLMLRRQLHRLLLEKRLQMCDTCAPFYSPHGPDEDLSPPFFQVPLL
jgi:hypothetical protein